MTELPQVYQILQNMVSKSSGSGVSYWSIAAGCGLKGKLYDLWQLLETEEEYEPGQLTPTGKPKVTGKIAGTFYHGLQEYWRTGRFSSPITMAVGDHTDINWSSAVAAFQNYRATFGNDIHNRGIVHSAEIRYPRDEDDKVRLQAAFGTMSLSMRYDLMVTVDEAKAEELLLTEGVIVKPGRWLIDHKLVAGIRTETLDSYRYSFQALLYPIMYNICNPDEPVEGILFDIAARVKNAERKHFVLIAAEAGPHALEVVKHGMAEAKQRFDAGTANPMLCDGTKFGACRFMTKNQCPRYGNFADFTWGKNPGEWSKKY